MPKEPSSQKIRSGKPPFQHQKNGAARKSNTASVRVMAPFSMTCEQCADFIYRGTKFNARKESTGETYFNMQLIRFRIRCPQCANEIVFRTDPQSTGYMLLSGAKYLHAPAAKPPRIEADHLNQLEAEGKSHTGSKSLGTVGLDKLGDVAATHAAELAREEELVRLQKTAKPIDEKNAQALIPEVNVSSRTSVPDPGFTKLELPPLKFRKGLGKI